MVGRSCPWRLMLAARTLSSTIRSTLGAPGFAPGNRPRARRKVETTPGREDATHGTPDTDRHHALRACPFRAPVRWPGVLALDSLSA